jgi:hypothetical protein
VLGHCRHAGNIRRRIVNRNVCSSAGPNYFGLAETPSTFERLDSWLRRRLRQVRWTEWKRPKARRPALYPIDPRLLLSPLVSDYTRPMTVAPSSSPASSSLLAIGRRRRSPWPVVNDNSAQRMGAD